MKSPDEPQQEGIPQIRYHYLKSIVWGGGSASLLIVRGAEQGSLSLPFKIYLTTWEEAVFQVSWTQIFHSFQSKNQHFELCQETDGQPASEDYYELW